MRAVILMTKEGVFIGEERIKEGYAVHAHEKYLDEGWQRSSALYRYYVWRLERAENKRYEDAMGEQGDILVDLTSHKLLRKWMRELWEDMREEAENSGELWEVEYERKIDVNAVELRVRLRKEAWGVVYFKLHHSDINHIKHPGSPLYREANDFALTAFTTHKIRKILVASLRDANSYESRRAFGDIIFEDGSSYKEMLASRGYASFHPFPVALYNSRPWLTRLSQTSEVEDALCIV